MARAAKRKASARADNGKVDVERLRAELDMESSTWAPIDLASILAGEQTTSPPSILPRSDEVSLLYRGKIHSLYGEPEAGKGWVALLAAASQLDAGERVVYIDFEDDPETAVERLRALDVPVEAIESRFRYLRPDEPLSESSRVDLEAALTPRPSLVVIDGMTEALAMEGINLNDNTEVAKWIVGLPRRIARNTGAAVLIIDHQAKDGASRGKFAIGAQHKLAGIHAAYSIKAVKPFGRGLNGGSQIKVEKDRPGHVRRHADEKVIAEMSFTSEPDSGAVMIELSPPNPEQWRPADRDRMEAVSLVVEGTPGLSRNAIRRAVPGKDKRTDEAIRILVAEGFVRQEGGGGRGRSVNHYSEKPYRQPTGEDENGSA